MLEPMLELILETSENNIAIREDCFLYWYCGSILSLSFIYTNVNSFMLRSNYTLGMTYRPKNWLGILFVYISCLKMLGNTVGNIHPTVYWIIFCVRRGLYLREPEEKKTLASVPSCVWVKTFRQTYLFLKSENGRNLHWQMFASYMVQDSAWFSRGPLV